MSDPIDTLRSMIGELKAENAWLRQRALHWRRRANQLLIEADGLECDIASALGWHDDGGKSFADQVRELRDELAAVKREKEEPAP